MQKTLSAFVFNTNNLHDASLTSELVCGSVMVFNLYYDVDQVKECIPKSLVSIFSMDTFPFHVVCQSFCTAEVTLKLS